MNGIPLVIELISQHQLIKFASRRQSNAHFSIEHFGSLFFSFPFQIEWAMTGNNR